MSARIAQAAAFDLVFRLMNSETSATAPQKAWVTSGPASAVAGNTGLVRLWASIHVNGSYHWFFSIGPVGPSPLIPPCSSPQ